MTRERGPEILWTDGGQDSEKAFEALMEGGVEFLEYRTDVWNVTDNEGFDTPCLMTGFGIFNGLRSIEGFAKGSPIMYELQDQIESKI